MSPITSKFHQKRAISKNDKKYHHRYRQYIQI